MNTILISNKISDECSIIKSGADVCMSESAVMKVAEIYDINTYDSLEDIINEAKNITGCTTEKCVAEQLLKTTNDEKIKVEIKSNFKVAGPTDDSLLANYEIDATLKQFSIMYPRFFPYNFNMSGYTNYCFRDGYVLNKPDTLCTINIAELFGADKYNCAGCIINSGTYQSNGKHWMALFVDARDANTATVEFFNSSGNAPTAEWLNWMLKTEEQLKSSRATKIIRASPIRQQNSKTECGVYSLYYIWARLQGVPASYFSEVRTDDKLMFEFRQHLFDGSKSKNKYIVKDGLFNWDDYQRNINVKWAKDTNEVERN